MNRTVLKRSLLAAAVISVPLSLHAYTADVLEAAVSGGNIFSGWNSALIVGRANLLNAAHSAAIGEGLKGGEIGSLTVGRYNTQVPTAIFAVGNGYYLTPPADPVRRNAFEVLNTGGGGNGTVNMPGAVSLGGTVSGQTVSIKGAATFNSTLSVTGANALTVAGVPVAGKGEAIIIGSTTTNTGGGIAAGKNTTAASGIYSFASGDNSKANGTYSFASGLDNVTAVEAHSAFALGFGNRAGFGVVANTGVHSMALGYFNQSKGAVSMTLGASNIANNNFSVAVGYGNRTWKYGQTVVGRFNKIPGFTIPDDHPGNDPAPSEDDEVFVVGGGSDFPDANRKNALTVKASGDTAIAGTLTMGAAVISSNSTGLTISKPVILSAPVAAGDIPMYIP